jgi:hypothetical protein
VGYPYLVGNVGQGGVGGEEFIARLLAEYFVGVFHVSGFRFFGHKVEARKEDCQKKLAACGDD